MRISDWSSDVCSSDLPMSVCITVPSCTLLFLPIRISSLSPRSTALYQTLAPSSRRTLPTSVALGATQLCGWVSTRASPKRYFMSGLGAAGIDETLGRFRVVTLGDGQKGVHPHHNNNH